MAWKPAPQRIHCPQCGWSSLYAPDSDALMPPPPESCAQCGSSQLTWQPAGFIGSLVAALSSRKR